MSPSSLLTWLLTLGALAWALGHTLLRSRGFGAHALAGRGMRRVAALYVPLLEAVLVLSLLGVALLGRRGGGAALGGGGAQLLMGVAVLCSLTAAVTVAVQGFTLSERLKRRGDSEGASLLATRGFFALLVGGLGVLLTLFAALILSNPAG